MIGGIDMTGGSKRKPKKARASKVPKPKKPTNMKIMEEAMRIFGPALSRLAKK